MKNPQRGGHSNIVGEAHAAKSCESERAKCRRSLQLGLLLCSLGAVSPAMAIMDLGVTLQDANDPVSLNGAFSYNIGVHSASTPVPVSELVTVDLLLPGNVGVLSAPQVDGWACQKLPFGGAARCTRQGFSANTDVSLIWKVIAPPVSGTISATAIVTPGGSSGANDSVSESTTASLTDLSLQKFSDPAAALIGAPYQYALTVSNSTLVPDTSRATIVDQMPSGVTVLHAWGAGWTCNQAGQQVTCQLSWDESVPAAGSSQPVQAGMAFPVLIDVLAPAQIGTVNNQAVVDSPADLFPNNDWGTNAITINGSAVATDLELALSASGPGSVPAGSPYNYVFSIKNNGPVFEAGEITVKAVIPSVAPGSMTVVDIAEGAGWNCSWAPATGVAEILVTCKRTGLAAGVTAPAITLSVLAGTPGTDRLRAWVSGTADTNPANNVKDQTKNIIASTAPNLQLTKVSNPAYPAQVARGEPYSYTLTASNQDPGLSGGVTVTDVLPAGVGFVSANGSGWSCNQAAGTVICTRLASFSGSAPPIMINVTAPVGAYADVMVNRAVLASAAGDPNTLNNVSAALTGTINSKPEAVDDSYATGVDQTLVVLPANGLLSNDTDADLDPLTAIIGDLPDHGQLLAFAGNGSFTYQPNSGFTGVDTFTYRASDSALISNFATAMIVVGDPAPGNQAPIAAPQYLATAQDTPKTIALTATDADGDPMTYAIAGDPDHNGTLTGAPPYVTYSPAPGFNGVETFTFTANDGTDVSNIAVITVTVGDGGAGNQAPVADPQYLATPQGAPKSISLTSTDPENSALSYTIVAIPNQNGQLTGALPNIVYTPPAGFNGIETFTFKSNDGALDSNVASVTITVGDGGLGNQAPVADPQTLATPQNAPKAITLTSMDPEGDNLVYAIVGNPNRGGQLTGTPPNLNYAPPAGFNGIETFAFKTNDGSLDSNLAEVTVIVGSGGPNNQAPVADPQTLSTAHGTSLPITLTATEPDGDVMSFSVVSLPNHGGQLLGTAPSLTYVPPVGFSGVETFTFKATDGTLDSNVATITINVAAPNQPPIADPQWLVTPQDSPLAIALTGIDPEGNLTTFTIVAPLNHGGQLIGTPPFVNYIPPAGFNGIETFTFKLSDGTLDSNVATVTITVGSGGPGNQAPVAQPQSLSTPQDVPLPITLIAIDPDSNPMAYSIVALPDHGGQLTGTPPNVNYVPPAGFNGIETFTFRASDGTLLSNVATVSVAVGNAGPGNQAPVAASQSVATAQDVPLSIVLTATDPDLDPLSYSLMSLPNHGGQLTGTAPNLTYTPPAGFNGIETFTFAANDGALGSNIATVTITVGSGGPGNQPPVAHPQSLSTAQDTPLSITLTADDPDADVLGFSVSAQPNHGGQLTGTAPNLIYTPPAGFNGIETFTFKATDGTLDSNTAIVTITVGSGGPGNQAPVAHSKSLITAQDTSLPVVLTATDPDGDTLSYAIVGAPNHGGQVTGAPPNVLYKPALGFNGVEVFTFKANDGTLDSNIASITITVGSGIMNTPPSILDQQLSSVAEDAHLGTAVGTVAATDDGFPSPPAALTYSITGGNPGNAFAINPATGVVTVAGPLDFETRSTYALTVSAFDGEFGDTAIVSIALTDVIGGPGVESLLPVVVDDAIQVTPGGTATVLIGGAESVLDNDFDLDGNLPLIAEALNDPVAGVVTLNDDGTFQYTNEDALAAIDGFDYAACDALGVCSIGTVTVTISNGPLDELPVALGDAIELAPGGTANTLVGGASSVLANDTDDDGDLLSAFLLTTPAHGVLSLNANGSFSYADDANDPTTSDSFMYEACDAHGACAAAEVTIAIVPPLPVVSCVLLTQVNEVGDSVLLDLSLLFTPPQGQGLSFGAVGLPSSLSVDSSSGLLTGMLADGDEVDSPYASLLTATTLPGGATANEQVDFVVLRDGEIIRRNGFDGTAPQPCQ